MLNLLDGVLGGREVFSTRFLGNDLKFRTLGLCVCGQALPRGPISIRRTPSSSFRAVSSREMCPELLAGGMGELFLFKFSQHHFYSFGNNTSFTHRYIVNDVPFRI